MMDWLVRHNESVARAMGVCLDCVDDQSISASINSSSSSSSSGGVTNQSESVSYSLPPSVMTVSWGAFNGWASIIVATILSAIVLLTICGNLLILAAVLFNSNLRGPTHILIANLAVADLLLGFLVLPFSATLEVTGNWYFGSIFCDVWAAVDVLCCTASIMSLCVISVDRYIGVTRPLNYYSIVTTKRSTVLCLIVWVASLAISIGPLLGWKDRGDHRSSNSSSSSNSSRSSSSFDIFSVNSSDFLSSSFETYECTVTTETGYVLFSAFGSFYLPTLIILCVYWRIYHAAIEQTKFLESGTKTDKSVTGLSSSVNNGGGGADHQSAAVTLRVHVGRTTTAAANGQSSPGTGSDAGTGNTGLSARLFKFRRQKKAAKTLGIVVGAFLLCWFPFFVVLPVQSLCSWCVIPKPLFSFCFWLGYCNSCLNPFIYASTSREFKRAFSKVLACGRREASASAAAAAQSRAQLILYRQQRMQQQQNTDERRGYNGRISFNNRRAAASTVGVPVDRSNIRASAI